jgi:tetratricopeptide (TPR) repeat protein
MNKIFIVFVLTFLLGCNNSIKNLSLKNSEDTIVKSNPKKIISSLNNYTAENESLVFAEKGVDLLNKGKYYEASDNFNLALKLDITNSYLQFFNAHTYHLIAKNHDTSKFDLAEEGYKLAIQFDKDNSQAYFYLGQLYLDQKKYSNAKNIFLEASYIDNSDSDLFYSLSFASYYALDPELALSTLKQACAISPIIDKCSKDMTIIKASLGEVNNLSNDQQEPLINQRVVDWNNFYENHLQYASFHSDDEEEDDEDYSEDEDYSDEKNSKNTNAKKVSQSSFQSDKQVITDVVIIQSID